MGKEFARLGCRCQVSASYIAHDVIQPKLRQDSCAVMKTALVKMTLGSKGWMKDV